VKGLRIALIVSNGNLQDHLQICTFQAFIKQGMYRSPRTIKAYAHPKQRSIKAQSYPSLAILTPNVILILHRNTLSHMIDLVDSYQPFRKLKHVISQTDDNELCILRPLLDVRSNN
jgi:hypothetical protein